MSTEARLPDSKVLLAVADLDMAACRAVTGLTLTDPAAAVMAVRAALGSLWPHMTPEAARIALASAATMAWEAGAASIPEPVADPLAAAMLTATGEWHRTRTVGLDTGAALPPPLALASTAAYDRNQDDTLTGLATLLAVAHLVVHADERG
jgi:hypothetical protein